MLGRKSLGDAQLGALGGDGLVGSLHGGLRLAVQVDPQLVVEAVLGGQLVLDLGAQHLDPFADHRRGDLGAFAGEPFEVGPVGLGHAVAFGMVDAMPTTVPR